jgi:hypothetical protein
LRDRRICFTFNARKQQILRCAQDDTLGEEFFSSLLEQLDENPIATTSLKVFRKRIRDNFVLCRYGSNTVEALRNRNVASRRQGSAANALCGLELTPGELKRMGRHADNV